MGGQKAVMSAVTSISQVVGNGEGAGEGSEPRSVCLSPTRTSHCTHIDEFLPYGRS